MTAVQTALVFDPPAPETLAKRRQRTAERDRTLEALQLGRRREIIVLAHQVALEMAAANACTDAKAGIPDGCVTTPQLHEELRRRQLLTPDEAAEARWLGGVVPGGTGESAKWIKVGMTNGGSKCRPVGVWKPREGSE